jgi:crossover junction endodeoxyribonuclease RusA
MTRTLTLPVADPKLLLTSNQRLHWAKKAELTAYWRALGAAAVDLYEVPAMQRAHVTVTLRWPDKRRRDPMNWWPTIKACVDGMVQSGRWIADDDDTHLIGPDMRRDPERGPHSIRIDIEEIT